MKSTHIILAILLAAIATPNLLRADLPYELPTNVKKFMVDGIEVIMRPSGPANHVIYAKLFIRGGITYLDDGVSPLIESLALDIPISSGPQGMDRATFQRELARKVIGISSSTDRDYSMVNMRCVDETFDRAWELFTGVILRPQYDPSELRNTKDRLVTALRNRYISPEAYASYIADSVFFYGHPYGRFAQESEIPGITEEVLRAHQAKQMVKSRLLLVVVGNVDSTTLYQKVKSSFSRLPQGSYKEKVLAIPQNAKSSRLVIRPPMGARAVTNYIVARYLAPSRSDSLYYPFMRLTSFVSGSLFREVRVERNLSYAPDADVTFSASPYGEITISTTLPDSAWRVAKGDVIDFFRNYVVADESVKSGLQAWFTSNYMREQTNESQASRLGEAEIYTGAWQNAFGVIDGISNISPEQMNEAAIRYLKNFTIVIVGDPDAITPSEYMADSSVERSSGGGSRMKSMEIAPGGGEFSK